MHDDAWGEKAGASTVTTQFTGQFRDDPARQVRFITLVKGCSGGTARRRRGDRGRPRLRAEIRRRRPDRGGRHPRRHGRGPDAGLDERRGLAEDARDGRGPLYSRSRQALWKKGETSGQVQRCANCAWTATRTRCGSRSTPKATAAPAIPAPAPASTGPSSRASAGSGGHAGIPRRGARVRPPPWVYGSGTGGYKAAGGMIRQPCAPRCSVGTLGCPARSRSRRNIADSGPNWIYGGAVHEPHHRVAGAGVAPQDVALAVAVIVAGVEATDQAIGTT